MKFRGLSIIGVVCLGIIYWINFTDIKLPELIDGKGQKFEFLIEGLCLSYISGYMFWLLNVYWVDKKEKKFILPFVAKHVFFIVHNNHSIINALKRDSSLSTDYFPDGDEFRELLAKVNPKESTFYYQREDLLYLIRNRQQTTIERIEKLLLSGRHLDDQLRSILLQLQDSLFLSEDYFNADRNKDENLLKYTTVFAKYFHLIKSLHNYYNKNLKDRFEIDSL